MADAKWALNDMRANIDSGKSDVLATTETFAREVVGPFMRVMVTGFWMNMLVSTYWVQMG